MVTFILANGYQNVKFSLLQNYNITHRTMKYCKYQKFLGEYEK